MGWRSRHGAHAALAVGIEGQQHPRRFTPHALLLLDPAESEPGLASFNARLEFGKRPRLVTAETTEHVTLEGAVSLRLKSP